MISLESAIAESMRVNESNEVAKWAKREGISMSELTASINNDRVKKANTFEATLAKILRIGK